MSKKSKSGGEKVRSAKTGRYVDKERAKTHPATTVVEHDKPKRPKPGVKKK